LQHVNNFRGIAILLIVFNHSFSGVKHDFFIMKILYCILDNITVLFVFIAGYLFSFLSKKFTYSLYLEKKITNVFLPYIFVSIPAVLLYLLKVKMEHRWIDMNWFYSSLNVVEQYFYLMVYGAHLGPFWFIPMIVLFYVISPAFYFLSKNSSVLLLSFIVSLGVAFFVGRPEFDDNPFLSFLFFLPAYLFGMLLRLNPSWYMFFADRSFILLSCSIVLSGFFYYFYSPVISSSIDLIVKLLFSFLGFVCCYTFLNYKVKWLDLFARLSFFIYFIHGYFAPVIVILAKKAGLSFGGPAALMWLVLFFLIIISMSLVSYVIAKVIFKNKSKIFIAA